MNTDAFSDLSLDRNFFEQKNAGAYNIFRAEDSDIFFHNKLVLIMFSKLL